MVVFGHDHVERDVTAAGRRFLNPGSVGCHERAEAPALLIAFSDGALSVEKPAAPYDETSVLVDFEERRVPEREFILRTFIRRR